MERPTPAPASNHGDSSASDTESARRRLHSPVEPNATGYLDVGDGHSLYWEECGRSDGIPVIYLHGGPGAGCSPVYRRFFEASRFRIILFDQRGAGRSRPYASINENTTLHLIGDIERLRQHLGVEKWLVFGGSWGSTLALAYGEAHPDRCLGFILRGVFLFRQKEVDWFLHGMGRFFPEAGRAWRDFLPENEHDDLLGNYYRRLASDDPAIHGPAAQAWTSFEDACSRLIPAGPATRDGMASNRKVTWNGAGLAMARLEAHYMVNRGFIHEGQLLSQVNAVRHLPCTIVQGRYDMVCPIESAMDLHQSWPDSRLVVVPDAGHSTLEPGICAALVEACDAFARSHSQEQAATPKFS